MDTSKPGKPIECPACGLINTAGSARCDCGHDLSAPAPPGSRHRDLWTIGLVVIAVVFAVLRAWLRSKR